MQFAQVRRYYPWRFYHQKILNLSENSMCGAKSCDSYSCLWAFAQIDFPVTVFQCDHSYCSDHYVIWNNKAPQPHRLQWHHLVRQHEWGLYSRAERVFIAKPVTKLNIIRPQPCDGVVTKLHGHKLPQPRACARAHTHPAPVFLSEQKQL